MEMNGSTEDVVNSFNFTNLNTTSTISITTTSTTTTTTTTTSDHNNNDDSSNNNSDNKSSTDALVKTIDGGGGSNERESVAARMLDGGSGRGEEDITTTTTINHHHHLNRSSSASLDSLSAERSRCSNRKIDSSNDDDSVRITMPIQNNNNSDVKMAEKPPAETRMKKKSLEFREKQFKVRPSLLTTLFDETDGRLLFNFFAAIFFLTTISVWIDDFFQHGNPLHHLWLFTWNFEQLPSTLVVWALMFGSTVTLPYYGATMWAHRPAKRLNRHSAVALTLLYLAYLIGLFYFPLVFVFGWRLNCACSFIITVENTRLAMKVHSFLRENFAKAVRKRRELWAAKCAEVDVPDHNNNDQLEKKVPLNDHNETEKAADEWPTLGQFVYFMFAPTFIYRDHYPRAESRCIYRTGRYFAQCLLSIYMLNIIFIVYVYPTFSIMDYEHGVRLGAILRSIFTGAAAGSGCMMMLFYGLLHSWLNMFAELLQFGDRQFYANWWGSKNMAEYYRNWNLVVHEWLYTYVFRDIGLVVGKGWALVVAQSTVFFLSSFFHEYWFGVSLRVFFPVIFFMNFVCGSAFFYISGFIRQRYVWNLIMWTNLMFGTGLFFAAYASEWYARQRCPRVFDSDALDFFVPRILTCLR